MLYACKCLNIILNSANNVPSSLSIQNDNGCSQEKCINLSSIIHPSPLSLQQCTNNKLKEDILQFLKTAESSAGSIESTIKHLDLVLVTVIEDWNVYYCINCRTITHAQSNAYNFVINSLLLTNQEEINDRKSHEKFSKFFEIIIKNRSNEITKRADKFNNLNNRSKNMKQYLRDVIQKEIEATDDRIKRYTEQQTILLKQLRERAEQDFENLISVPDLELFGCNLSDQTNNANAKMQSDLDTPPVTPDSTPMSLGNSPNIKQQPTFLAVARKGLPNNRDPIQHSSPYQSFNKTDSIKLTNDSDIFFDMDGFDCQVGENIGSLDDSIDDDEDDSTFDSNLDNDVVGVKMTSSLRPPRPRVCIAQSLPMAVPIFGRRTNDEDVDESIGDENVDIAASIKALAKSVHGEAVFGDLPRPRFSTQI